MSLYRKKGAKLIRITAGQDAQYAARPLASHASVALARSYPNGTGCGFAGRGYFFLRART